MNKVSVADCTGKADRISHLVSRVIRNSLKSLNISRVDVSIALITDSAMRKLNRRYRKINRSTDVLSFAQENPYPSGRKLLGDIVIATPTARRQARKLGHSIEKEFATLAIHGLLHLLGYDHEKPKRAKTMFSIQETLLKKVCRAE